MLRTVLTYTIAVFISPLGGLALVILAPFIPIARRSGQAAVAFLLLVSELVTGLGVAYVWHVRPLDPAVGPGSIDV